MTKFKIFLLICILICTNLLFSIKTQQEKTEVVFWTVQLSPFEDYMNNVIKEFEQRYPNIKIKWVDVPYAEAEKRVLASLLSNSMPDLVNITSDFNMSLASKGALAEVKNGFDDYNPEILATLTYDEKVWGVPFYATSAITVYNKELLSEFAITSLPKTYVDLFKQMSEAPVLPNKYLFMPTLTENDTTYKILNKYGLNTPEMLATEESVAFFEVLKYLYENEKIPKEAITQTHREVLEKYSSGQIAYLQVGANFLNIIRENSLDVYEKTDVAQQFFGENEAFDFSLMTLAVPKKARFKQEAFLFARFLTNSENQLAFAKRTGVLPCNKVALTDEYFVKYDSNDLIGKARFIGATQLLAPIKYPMQTKKHKEIIDIINKLVEEILLEKNDVKKILSDVSQKWQALLAN